MKKVILSMLSLLLVSGVYSQENLVSLSAGYSWANINISDYVDTDSKLQTTGWRINGTYDFNEVDTKISYGLSVGYTNMQASYNGIIDTLDFTVSLVPIYFAPKFLFGNDRIKAFVKLAIGGESTTIKYTSKLGDEKFSGFGFYGGAGGGLMLFVTESIFINAEYEIAYSSSSYYNGEWIQSALFGLGIRF